MTTRLTRWLATLDNLKPKWRSCLRYVAMDD